MNNDADQFALLVIWFCQTPLSPPSDVAATRESSSPAPQTASRYVAHRSRPPAAPLKVMAFVLKQPALLAESRAAAQELSAQLQARASATTIATLAAAAAATDFAAIATEVLNALRQIA